MVAARSSVEAIKSAVKSRLCTVCHSYTDISAKSGGVVENMYVATAIKL